MEGEWRGSAHARADTDPIYVAIRERVGGARCDRCHAPLRGRVDDDDVVGEGVTCEVCHTMDRVTPARSGASFRLRLEGNVRYAARCDAHNQYFHRMGCSPLHAQATFCAACHYWYAGPGGALPVLTEWEEWQSGPWADEPCQTCHMPGARAELAVGAGARDGVPHHGMMGRAGELRSRALSLDASATVEGASVVVSVSVRNERAGHSVPTGLPERRVVVRAIGLDATGGEVARAEHAFGRRLVDAQGAEAPFWDAERVASDDRIAPHQQAEVRLTLTAAGIERVEVTVDWQAFSPAIATRIGVSTPPDERMAEAHIEVRPPTGGHRGRPRPGGSEAPR